MVTEICLISLNDKSKVCENCKQLNNQQNTVCRFCNTKFKIEDENRKE